MGSLGNETERNYPAFRFLRVPTRQGLVLQSTAAKPSSPKGPTAFRDRCGRRGKPDRTRRAPPQRLRPSPTTNGALKTPGAALSTWQGKHLDSNPLCSSTRKTSSPGTRIRHPSLLSRLRSSGRRASRRKTTLNAVMSLHPGGGAGGRGLKGWGNPETQCEKKIFKENFMEIGRSTDTFLYFTATKYDAFGPPSH